MPLSISVIIPTFGRPELARAAALSALAQRLPKGAKREVLVVDDGGTDGTLALLGKNVGLRYVWKEHAGPAAARNFGARLARGGILAFLDSDTLAQKGWLAAGLDRLGREPSLFAVEGRVLPDRDSLVTPFTESVQNLNGGRFLSCNLFVRREGFLKLGGFDERYKQPIREDSEFAFRALEAGKTFTFEAGALVLHPVREVGMRRFFYHAQEGKYEALLRRSHPQSYRKHFKWLDGRAVPAYYWAHLGALVLIPASLGSALAVWICGVAAVLYSWCRKRKIRALDPFRLLFPAVLVPYARFFWVLVGEIRYPQSPE